MKSFKLLFFVIIALVSSQTNCFSQFNEGDSAKFWSVTYNDWPPLIGSPQREVSAVCKKVGSHCYVFVEKTAPQPTQSSIDALVNDFDNHYFDSLTSVYGPVPNVFDNDPKICILVFNETDWAGYFDPGQQMPDTMVYRIWNRHSNQREIIYVSAGAFSIANEIVTHEFGHMLHWQQDHSPEPISNPVKYWEDAWVDEGFSTFAAIYLTENIYQHNVMDNEAFFATNPDKPLIYFSDYNQVKLFMLFMYEHYGRWNYISSLISNQLNGIAGVNSTLNQLGSSATFDDAFEQWTIANYVDDSLYAEGKYSYAHYNFPAANIESIHAVFPTNIMTKTVNPYGSDYVVFSSATPKSIVVDFSGQTDSKFRVDFILKNTIANQIDTIIRMPLDAFNHGTFNIDSLGTTFNKAIMVIMNLDSSIQENSVASYTYSATLNTAIEKNELNTKLSIFPNPTATILNVATSNNLWSQIEIRDVQGRLQWSESFFNSSTIDLSSFAKGVYFISLINTTGVSKEKFVVN